MVFVPKTAWDELPGYLAEHMAKTYRVGVPFEPDVLVFREDCARGWRLDGCGQWFAGRVGQRQWGR